MNDRVLILAVDDDPLQLNAVKRLLVKKGFDVETGVDPRKTLTETLDRHDEFGLLLTDKDMSDPCLDGIALILALRREETVRGLGRLPAILWSAGDIRRARGILESAAAPYQAVIPKGDPGLLLLTISRLLGQ